MQKDLKNIFGSTTGLDDKSMEYLTSALAKNNLPGFDYLEFKQSLGALASLNMDEATAYKSAFATASTVGLTKEKLLKDRRIVIAHRDDTTGKLYSGPAARTLLGLPVDADVEVEPGSLGKWTVFVQSASPTRKTVRDVEFLWDKTATGNVKATWSYDKKA